MDVAKEAAAAKALLDQADAAEANANECKWKAAQKLAALVDTGLSSRNLAQMVGRSHTRVQQIVRTYKEFGGKRAFHSFNECERMLAVPPEKRESVKDEAAAAGKGLTRFIDEEYKIGRETKADRVKRYLADPEVAARVATDDEARVAFDRAKDHVDRQQTERVRDRQRRETPDALNHSEFLSALNDIAHARRRVSSALRSLQEVEPFTDEHRQMLEDDLSWLENAVGLLRSFTESTGRNLDAEFAALLKNEGR